MKSLVDRKRLEETLASLLQRVLPDARVEVIEHGFLGDILEARIELGRSDETGGDLMIKEPATYYGPAASRPVNLLISAEAAREMLANPEDHFGPLERMLSARSEREQVAYWMLTTGGLQQITVSSEVAGTSEEFVQDLADRLAIEEGRAAFKAWIAKIRSGVGYGDGV